MRLQNLIGLRFGRLRVIGRATRHGDTRWVCLCDCGTTKTVKSKPLRNGMTRSCGCLHKEQLARRVTTHGMCRTSEYRIWKLMIVRCHNASNPSFVRYGARGITVCDAWRSSFEAFFADMGPRPSLKHSIDRRDNDAGYCPENCRWVTRDVQAANKRGTIRITVDGETRPLVEWCRMTGACYEGARLRLHRGDSPKAALFGPFRKPGRPAGWRQARPQQ